MKYAAETNKPFFLNYGWEHFWCDPNNFKNFAIREFIKGPFEKPKFAYPIPYVTLCQQDGSWLTLSQGIPDCWLEYLTCKLEILRKHPQYYDLMHKKDVDIVPHLRKNYRLYIGQGIPDPWTKYPHVNILEDFSLNNLNEMTAKQRTRFKDKFKDEVCFCCKKKYLFECPDKCEAKSCHCSCKICHSGNTSAIVCSEKCKCFEALRNRSSKKPYSKREKKRALKKGLEFSSSSSSCMNSSTEEGGHSVSTKHESTLRCGCCSNPKTLNESSGSEKIDLIARKSFNFNSDTRPKEHSKVCVCPYRKKSLKNKDNKVFPQSVQSVSKLIQAEIQPIKISKTVQTENRVRKKDPKCECRNKCFQCSFFQCKTPGNKASCLARRSFSNFCFAPSVPHCPAFVCPFSAPNHHAVCKPSKKQHCKNKHFENRESEDELNYEQSDTDGNEFQQKHNKKSDNKEKEVEKTRDKFNNNKNVYFCLKSPKTLDHSKYPPNDKLKSYSIKKDSFARIETKKHQPQSSYLHSNLYTEGKSICNLRPDNVLSERFKTFSYFKPSLNSEFSFNESKVSSNKSRLLCSNIRRFNCSDQATMTLDEERKIPKKDVLNDVKGSKQIIKNNEIGKGLARKSEEFPKKTMKKRRKLLTNRKRRRKLASSGKVSLLEYQAFLNKITNKPELLDEHSQMEKTPQKVPLMSNFLNFNKNDNLVLRNSSLKSTLTKDSVRATLEREISTENSTKFADNTASEYSLKQPLQSELQFGGILEKISYNSGSTWSSSTLKNIVNDLLAENNSSK